MTSLRIGSGCKKGEEGTGGRTFIRRWTATGKPQGKRYFLPVLALLIAIVFIPIPTRPLAGHSSIHRLTILHTNDTHGHPVKFSYYPDKDVGGLPARATLIRQIREKQKQVLLLDAGDLNTGQAESNLFKAKPDLEGYNYIGYDAMVLGNHEFDNPLSVLKEQMETARFPFLAANVKTRDGRYLAQPYLIKEFEGFKVAVFGLTTKATETIGNRESVRDLIFEDEVAVARRLVPVLKEKADIIIALVHMGLFESSKRGSKRLASEVDGIDLIVDGHSHTRLEAPVFIKRFGSDRATPIAQAWQWGLRLGKVDLWIRDKKVVDLSFEAIPINLREGDYQLKEIKEIACQPEGTKVNHTPFGLLPKYLHDSPFSAQVNHAPGELLEEDVGLCSIPQPYDEPLEEDPGLCSILQPYVARTESILSEVICRAEGPFFNKESRERETALGDLIADSMLWYTKKLGVDFAIQNGGGMKTSLLKGAITSQSVHELLPFDNSVVVLTLSGAEIKALLDHIASLPAGCGAFPQVSEGIHFTINRAAGTCEQVRIGGQPIDPKGIYKVATNSYLAGGGNDYQVFLKALDTYDTSRFQRDIFIEYLHSLGRAIRPKVHGRITIRTDRGSFIPCFLRLPAIPLPQAAYWSNRQQNRPCGSPTTGSQPSYESLIKAPCTEREGCLSLS